MDDAEILNLRRKARAEKSLVDANLVDLHRRAAEELIGLGGEEIRAEALRQIDRWERDKLCSPRYIIAWRGILNSSVDLAVDAILRDDAEGVALRQNSPFGFLVNEGSK